MHFFCCGSSVSQDKIDGTISRTDRTNLIFGSSTLTGNGPLHPTFRFLNTKRSRQEEEEH